MSEIFLLYFFVVFFLESLVGGQDVVFSEEGVADLIDDIHAG